MANRIRIDTRLLDVNWTTGTTYKLAIGAGLVREVGNNRSYSAAQTTTATTSTVFSAKTFTTFDSGPSITTVTPILNTTGSFATTASITFNRTIYENTTPNNLFLYKEIDGGPDELIATFTTESSRVSFDEKSISIDLKDIIDGNSTYYLENTDPIFVDMFRFASEKLNNTKFKYSTGRPDIVSVTPSFETTGSYITTATINFDRDIKTKNGNFLLYKGDGTLVETISTASTRVTIINNVVKISLNYLLEGDTEYYIEGGDTALIDKQAHFRAERITENNFKYSTGEEPNIVSVSPLFETTNTFVTAPSITFDKNVVVNDYETKNLSLYKNGILIRIFEQTSENIDIDNLIASIVINDQATPEDVYHLEYDYGFFRDVYTLPAENISDNSILKWVQTTISNMGLRKYKANVPYALFTSTTPQILDIDLNPNKQYTFLLSSNKGTFTATQGLTTGTDYIFTATTATINQIIPTIQFTRNEPNRNDDITFNYSLSKDGSLLVNKTVDLIGIPFPLGVPLNLVISNPRVVDEDITFTASVTTSTEMSGTVNFSADNIIFGSDEMSVAGVATTMTAFASTGTKMILATWLETTVVDGNRYETLNSAIQEIFVDLADRLYDGVLIVGTHPRTTSSIVSITATLNTSTQFNGTSSGKVTFFATTQTFQYDTVPVSYQITATTVTKDINGVYDNLRFTSTTTLPEVVRTSAISNVDSYGDRLQLIVNGQTYDNRNYDYLTIDILATKDIYEYYNGSWTARENAFEIASLTTSSLVAAGIQFSTSSYVTSASGADPTDLPNPFGSENFDLYFDNEKVTDINNFGNIIKWRLVNQNPPATSVTSGWILEPYVYSSNWNIPWAGGWLRVDVDNINLVYPSSWETKKATLRVSRLDSKVNNFNDIYYKLYTSGTGTNYIEVWDASSGTQYTNTTSTIRPTIFDNWSSLSTATVIFTATSRVSSTGTINYPTYLDLRSPLTGNGPLLGTSTFVNNVATLDIQPGVFVRTGTYGIYANWEGRWVVPKFYGTQSQVVNQIIAEKSTADLLVSSPNFYIRNTTGTDTNSITTASIELVGFEYNDRKPTGIVSLYDGATLLGTGTLTINATTTISWNPSSKSQVDAGLRTLTASYPGDEWNSLSSTTTTFLAETRRTPAITLTATSQLFERPDPIRLIATTDASAFNGRLVSAVEGVSTLTTATFTGSQAILQITNTSFSTGTHNVFAKFAGDYNFGPSTSTAITFVADKRTINLSYTVDKDSPYWINPVYINVLASNVDGTVKPASVTLKDNGTTVETQSWSAGDTFIFGPLTFTSSNHTISLEIPEDTTYKAATISAIENFVMTPAPQNITQQGSNYTINSGGNVTLRIYTPELVNMPSQYRSGISFEMRPNASSGASILSTAGDPFTDGYKEWVVRYIDDGNYSFGIYTPQVVATGNQYWIGSSYPRFVANWTVRVNN